MWRITLYIKYFYVLYLANFWLRLKVYRQQRWLKKLEKKGMEMNKFKHAQRMSKKHPATFNAPSFEELHLLKKGDIVKVCYKNERFWNVIVSTEGEQVKARIDNDLVLVDDFKYGDIILFNLNNIYDIYKREG